MNGYEIYGVYTALKLHFKSESYDFFKFNGKTRISVDSFERRKDKYTFHRLARMLKNDEVIGFFVSNFLMKQKAWTHDFLEPEAMEIYREWRKKYESLSYVFDQDIAKIVERVQPQMMFKVPQNGEYPVIWTMMNQHEITFETVVILHGITGMLDLWDRHYSSDYIYEKTSKLIRKYEPFLGIDVPRLKEIVRKHLTAA